MSIRDRFVRFTAGRLPIRSINDHDPKIIELEKECEKNIDTFEFPKDWKNTKKRALEMSNQSTRLKLYAQIIDLMSLLVWKECEPEYKNEIAEISKTMADLAKSIRNLVNQLNTNEQPRPVNTIKKED